MYTVKATIGSSLTTFADCAPATTLSSIIADIFLKYFNKGVYHRYFIVRQMYMKYVILYIIHGAHESTIKQSNTICRS